MTKGRKVEYHGRYTTITIVILFYLCFKNNFKFKKTIQIPIPCPASFCCQLLQMKASTATYGEGYKLVEVHNTSGGYYFEPIKFELNIKFTKIRHTSIRRRRH